MMRDEITKFFCYCGDFDSMLQGLYLWDNLIDTEKTYHFKTELEVCVNVTCEIGYKWMFVATYMMWNLVMNTSL